MTDTKNKNGMMKYTHSGDCPLKEKNMATSKMRFTLQK